MNSRITRAAGRIALATALTVIAAVAHTQGQAKPDADFTKVADDFSAAWNKGDAAAIATLHTEDALRLNGDGTVANGRAAIQQGMTEALGGMWKGTSLTITAGQSKRVTDDVYVAEGKYQISGGTPPAGVPTSGSYMNTLIRRGGRWMLAGTAVLSPPPAAR